MAMAQRSASWALYGQPRLACLTAQLVLAHGGALKADESTVLALCTIARRFSDAGKRMACDQILKFAATLFRNPWLPEGSILRLCISEIAFLRALHRTDWTEAELRVSDASAIESAATGKANVVISTSSAMSRLILTAMTCLSSTGSLWGVCLLGAAAFFVAR
jgi:hypothetical protein